MKAYLCNDCKYNKNGWCYVYQCNGKARIEICEKYKNHLKEKDKIEYAGYRQAPEYDKNLCSTISMEECAELIQAISKAKRGKLDKDNLAEEIADVIICMDWVMDIYEISKKEVEKWLDYKKNRMNTIELVQWINKLIDTDRLWKFYKSIEFRHIKEEVLREQHYECQECKKKGKITKANTVHHVQFVRKHPELALSKY